MVEFNRSVNDSVTITKNGVVIGEYSNLIDILIRNIGEDIIISNEEIHYKVNFSDIDFINGDAFSGTIEDAKLALADTVFSGGASFPPGSGFLISTENDNLITTEGDNLIYV